MKSSIKICPQCGRKYSDIIMRCPACEKDLIDVNEGQGDNAQQLIEEREQLEAMQRRLKLQQQELKEEQQRFAEQQKLEEQRKFAEQQKIKEEQQKRKKRQQKIVVSSVSASAVIVALGAVVLYNRPWEQITALSSEQSTESIMKSDTTTAYYAEDILPTVSETPTTALSAPSVPAETKTSATIPIDPSAIVPMETAAQEPSQIPAPTPEPSTPAMLQEMHMAETEEDIDGIGFYIGLVTDFGGVNDGSFNQSAWEGLQRAGEAFGCEVKYIESKGDADYVPNIESFLDEDYDLIVCVGYTMADAVRDAAELYPDQKFAIIDDDSNEDLDNVTCLMFAQEQASYLAGLAAGYTTESNIVGFVIGASNETMNAYGYGYLAGVLDANPDAEILQFNANSFYDTAIGKSAVNIMVTKGADIIFHAAGSTGLGVINGCKENGIWAIGVDSDQSSLAPETILTSAVKRVDNACYDAAKKTIIGTLEGGLSTYNLIADGVDIAPTTDNLSKDVLEKIEKAKNDIIAGDLEVPKNKEEFEKKYGDVYDLD